MNTFIILFAMAWATLSFKPRNTGTTETSTAKREQFAQEVLASFRQISVKNYIQLFPKIHDFQKIMLENAWIYGNTLTDAQEEFARTYEKQVLPDLKRSFDRIVDEGVKKGIDWKNVEFGTVEASTNHSITINFTSRGHAYKLLIHKVLVIQNDWRVTQYLELV